MRRKFAILVTFLSLQSAWSQIHEIGVFAGGSNLISDVGATNYIAPDEFAWGVVYKWNRSTRHAWRFSYTHSNLTANDADSDMNSRQLRGLASETSINEYAAGIEFNFFDFDLHEMKFQITPYVYTGLAYTRFSENYFDVDLRQREIERKGTLAIPINVGIKTNIAPNFVLGAEVGIRYTFSDNLDGSNPKSNDYEMYRFGNINNKDWYTFTGLTLTYTFGEKPCFCAD